MSEHKEVGGRFLTPTVVVLLGIIGLAGYFLVQRFAGGIGAVSNLNDGYPWGIWVVIDIVVGTAFGCGGFAMALLCYIFNKGQYHPLMRPALLGGLFGYTLAGIAVLIDLGRYWQGYNIVLPWYAQPNSVMFEVALCVMLYITVLWIEFSPAFMEKLGMHGLKKFLKKYMFFFIALGVLLPTMHQSSLGSLLLVLGEFQLSPLYFTPMLPLLFLTSALTMGYSIVIFEGYLVSKTLGTPDETPILQKMSKVVLGIVVLFLVLRFGDLIARGQLGLAFAGDLNGTMFLLENILYLVAVALMFGKPGARSLVISAWCLLMAGSLYRIDAFLVAYNPGNGWTYFPSVPEIVITLGVVSLEIVLYLLFIKKLPVLSAEQHA